MEMEEGFNVEILSITKTIRAQTLSLMESSQFWLWNMKL